MNVPMYIPWHVRMFLCINVSMFVPMYIHTVLDALICVYSAFSLLCYITVALSCGVRSYALILSYSELDCGLNQLKVVFKCLRECLAKNALEIKAL